MDVRVTAVYGGSPISKQIRSLQGFSNSCGTPGRTLDLIEKTKTSNRRRAVLVLDEADEMLSMGFQDELDAILANTPEYKQTLFLCNHARGYEASNKKIPKRPQRNICG